MFQKKWLVSKFNNSILLPILGAVAILDSSAWAVPQCAPEDYVKVDATEVRIQFQGSDYEPRCVSVKPGTRVILPASAKHPFQAMPDQDEVKNPFAAFGVSEAEVSEVVTAPGIYGYFCTRHGDATGDGMSGAILVAE